jgi:hypothetical protein
MELPQLTTVNRNPSRTATMTSLSFLIDTDWVIDRFNAVAQVPHRLKELEPHGLGLSECDFVGVDDRAARRRM